MSVTSIPVCVLSTYSVDIGLRYMENSRTNALRILYNGTIFTWVYNREISYIFDEMDENCCSNIQHRLPSRLVLEGYKFSATLYWLSVLVGGFSFFKRPLICLKNGWKQRRNIINTNLHRRLLEFWYPTATYHRSPAICRHNRRSMLILNSGTWRVKRRIHCQRIHFQQPSGLGGKECRFL